MIEKLKPNHSSGLLSITAFIFLNRFFLVLGSLLVMFYFSHHLSIENYGQYQKIWIYLNLFTAFTCLGLPTYFLNFKTEQLLNQFKSLHRNQIVGFGLWVLLLCCCFALLQFNALNNIYIPVLTAFFFTFSIILEAFLINAQYYKKTLLINIIYFILFCAIHYQWIQKKAPLQELFIAILILVVLKCCSLVYLFVQLIKNSHDTKVMVYSSTEVKKLWLHLGFYDVIQQLFRWTDKLLVSSFLTLSSVAIYFNGTQEVPFLSVLLGAMGTSILMNLAQQNKDLTPNELLQKTHQASNYLAAIVFPIFMFFLLFKNLIITKIFGIQYKDSIPIFFIASWLIPLRSFSYTTLLQYFKKVKIINIGAIIDWLLALLLAYPLYQLFGLKGIALAFVLSTYCQAIYYLFHISKCLHTVWWKIIPLKKWGFNFCLSFIILGLFYFTPKFGLSEWIQLILAAIITMILVIFLIIKTKKNEYKA